MTLTVIKEKTRNSSFNTINKPLEMMFLISIRLGDKEHWRSRDLEIVVVDIVNCHGCHVELF